MRSPRTDPDLDVSREFRVARGRLAGASKHKFPPEELARLRAEMTTAAMKRAITAYVQSAPPLSDAQVEIVVSTLLSAVRNRADEAENDATECAGEVSS